MTDKKWFVLLIAISAILGLLTVGIYQDLEQPDFRHCYVNSQTGTNYVKFTCGSDTYYAQQGNLW